MTGLDMTGPGLASVDWASTRLPGLGEGTVAVVTGGTGAIGRRLSEILVMMGASVAMLARSPELVAKVTAGLVGGAPVHGIAADVGERAALAEAVAAAAKVLGPPTVLINSAAVGTVAKPGEDPSEEEVDVVLRINVKGALNSTLVCAPYMREVGCGRIVNVSSVAAYRGLPGHAIYGASKAAVHRLTRQMAIDLGPDGITVNSVSPGQTPTRIRGWDEAPGAEPAIATSKQIVGDRIPLGRRGDIDDYIGPILFLASDLARYTTGVDIPVEGGALARL